MTEQLNQRKQHGAAYADAFGLFFRAGRDNQAPRGRQ